jgi:hypothetical protein
VLLAAASLAAPSQPGYDPWAWLLWGREVVELRLDTVDGPAFKPLPVAVCALLAPLGDPAPALWLLVARAAAALAVLMAGRVAFRLSGGSTAAAALAVAGVALCEGWWWHAAIGNSEGLLLALGLLAADAALDDRHGRALAFAVAAALVRTEAWPLLGLYGLWLWARRPALRPWLAAGAVAVPAAWLLPELWGSGDLLRSSERARIPNPGQPATADRPAWASLREAAEIPLLPLALAAPAALAALSRRRGPALSLAAAGAGWVALVAAMAEAGYSGEPRYALPGVALLAVAGAAAVGRLGAGWTVALALLCAPFAVARVDDVRSELRRAAADAELWGSLPEAVEAADRAGARRRCGPPSTGRYRGTGVAWALNVPKREVDADSPVGRGLVLRSRIRPGAAVMPRVPPDAPVIARSKRWEIRCVPASPASRDQSLPHGASH